MKLACLQRRHHSTEVSPHRRGIFIASTVFLRFQSFATMHCLITARAVKNNLQGYCMFAVKTTELNCTQNGSISQFVFLSSIRLRQGRYIFWQMRVGFYSNFIICEKQLRDWWKCTIITKRTPSETLLILVFQRTFTRSNRLFNPAEDIQSISSHYFSFEIHHSSMETAWCLVAYTLTDL